MWEIILPADFNYFRIKTKNPIKTLQKVLPKAEVVAVCPPSNKSVIYFYIDKEEFEKLMNGESIRVTTTTIPFNGYGRGILEAWGTITISLNFFS